MKATKIPREIQNALEKAETAYIITSNGDNVESFLIGQGCPCCQADTIIDNILAIMQAEASDETQPQIFTQLMEIVNHEEGRLN